MNPQNAKYTPYQIATLAARISPNLCVEDQKGAIGLAWELIYAAHAEDYTGRCRLSEMVSDIREEMSEGSPSEEDSQYWYDLDAFLNLYGLDYQGLIPFKKAMLIATGHFEDRQVSRAQQKFDALLLCNNVIKNLSTLVSEKAERELRDKSKILEYLETEGFPVEILVSLRTSAEVFGICKKKFLTGNLQQSAEKPLQAPKKVAQPRKKVASKAPNRARKRRVSAEK